MQLEKPVVKTAVVSVQGFEDGVASGRPVNIKVYDTTTAEVESVIRSAVNGHINVSLTASQSQGTVSRAKRKYAPRKPKTTDTTTHNGSNDTAIAASAVGAAATAVAAMSSIITNDEAPTADTGAASNSTRPTPQALALIARFKVAVAGLIQARAKLSPTLDINSVEAYNALEPARDKIQLVYDEAVRRNVLLPADAVTLVDSIFDGMEFDKGVIQQHGKRLDTVEAKAEQNAEATGKELAQLTETVEPAPPTKPNTRKRTKRSVAASSKKSKKK